MRKLIKRLSGLRISGKVAAQDVAEAAGFGVLVYAAWDIERIAGMVLLGGVLLFYGNGKVH